MTPNSVEELDKAMKDLAPSQKETRPSVHPGPAGASMAPPAYGIDFLDREQPAASTDTDVLSAPTETDDQTLEDSDGDAILDDSYQEYRGAAFRLGDETHRVVIKIVGDEVVAGVESDFRTLQQIKKTLLDLADEAGHELEGEEDDIEALFEDAEAANETFTEKRAELRSAMTALREASRLARQARQSASVKGTKGLHKLAPSTRKAPQSSKKKLDRLREERDYARGKLTEAEHALNREVVLAIEAAWENYSDFLGPNLMPVGVVFRERDFLGDTRRHTYYTGADAANAIPIVWYKAPTDYLPVVTSDGTEHTLAGTAAGSVTIGTKKLGVANANRPNNGAFQLRKVAHEGDRTGQKAFNDALNDNDAGVKLPNRVVKNALGAGGFDGDHVKDLGFNGLDREDNYWPLLARINRRAFNGYNSGYIVNYINNQGQHKAKSIGGLIGKYFRVKDFIPHDGVAIPDESRTRYAGTTDIKP